MNNLRMSGGDLAFGGCRRDKRPGSLSTEKTRQIRDIRSHFYYKVRSLVNITLTVTSTQIRRIFQYLTRACARDIQIKLLAAFTYSTPGKIIPPSTLSLSGIDAATLLPTANSLTA